MGHVLICNLIYLVVRGPKCKMQRNKFRFYEMKVLPGGAAELREIAEKMLAMQAATESWTLVLLS